jgi:RHS repeat-associated protein
MFSKLRKSRLARLAIVTALIAQVQGTDPAPNNPQPIPGGWGPSYWPFGGSGCTICPPPRNSDGGLPNGCSSLTAASGHVGSILFSMELGRTSFTRKTSYMRSAVAQSFALDRTFRLFSQKPYYRDFEDAVQFYRQSPLTCKRDYQLSIAQENITSSSFLSSSALTFDGESPAETHGVGGVGYTHQQILTDDLFVDIQPLTVADGTTSSDVSDIWSMIPTSSDISPAGKQGYLVRTWLAEEALPISGGYRPLPSATTVLGYYFVFNPDTSLGTTRRLEIVQRAKFGGSTFKDKGWIYKQDTSTHDWTMNQYDGLPPTSSTTGPLIAQELLDVTAYTSANAFVQTRTRTEREFSPTSTLGTTGTMLTSAVTQETYSDVGGLSRLTQKIEGYGTANARTTQYGYFDVPTDNVTFGSFKWQLNPDGSYEYYEYTDFDVVAGTGNVIKYTPYQNNTWTPGSTPPTIANSVVEVTNILSEDERTTTTTANSTTIAKRNEKWTTDGSGYHVLTTKVYTGGTNYLVTATGYFPDTALAYEAGRIAWQDNSDGTVETYAYTAPSSGSYTQTYCKGAGSHTSGVTQGTMVVSTRNLRGFVTAETTSYLNSATSIVATSSWLGDLPDNFGRPTRKTWNSDTTDREFISYGCCGILSETNSKGIVTDYFQDDLKRVSNTKVTAGARITETQTAFHGGTGGMGLVTTINLKGTVGSSTGTVFLKETQYSVNGEANQILTPAQDVSSGTLATTYTYAYAISGGSGRVVTATYPDGGTTITSYMVDGQLESITGTAAADVKHLHGTYSVSTGPLVGTGTTQTKIHLTASSSDPNYQAEYQIDYFDQAGRLVATQVPNHSGSGADEYTYYTYYTASDSAGERGLVKQSTDFDGVTKTYDYDAVGRLASLADPMPAGGTRTTITTYQAASSVSGPSNAAPIVGPVYLTTTTVTDGTTPATTSVTTTGGFRKADRRSDFNRPSTITLALGSAGSWTETTSEPATATTYTTTVKSYVDGVLVSIIHYDTAGVALSGAAYGYDAIGRLANQQDLRTTSSGQINYTYNAAGRVLSRQESSGRGVVYTYDTMGRVTTEDTYDSTGHSLNKVTSHSYYLTGLPKATWGKQTYPTFRVYDEQLRLTELRTYQGLTTADQPLSTTAGYASTSWVYSPGRGWLNSKTDAASPTSHTLSYAYTAAGRLNVRTGSRGLSTTYSYTDGLLTTVAYSDSATPNVAYQYDGYGRCSKVTQTVQTTSKVQSMFDYHYNATNFRLDQETVSYLEQATAGTYALVRTISHPTDGLDRPIGFNITYGSPVTSDGSATVAYSATTGRIATVSGASMGTFTYSYAPSSNLVSKIDTGSFSRNYTYESTRDVVDTVENDITSPATVVSKYDYTVNDLTQRTAVTTSGTAFSGSGDWAWGYNDRGEITSADSSLGTFDRAYAFDSIGNRTTSVEGSLTLGSPNYVANNINQYTTVPTGIAPTYDLDGNETSGRVHPVGASETSATMTWDSENRLTSATTAGGTTLFLYDAYGRKMLRQIPGGSGGFRYAYLYDGWNDIKQYYIGTSSTVSIAGYQTNLWGPDISGTASGAGGVGGLLATRGGPVGHTYDAAYDGNGNVTEYVDVTPSTPVLSAHFEYDAFGKTLKDNDTNQNFDHRFSTKQVDWNTGLNYFGYRWHDPASGRWLSNDPIGELGGENLLAFSSNDSINLIDYLGWIVKIKGAGGMSDNDAKAEYNKAKDYLKGTKSGEIIDELEKNKKKITILVYGIGVGNGVVTSETAYRNYVIEWDCRGGFLTKTGGLSPATGLGHEAGHAKDDLDDPNGFKTRTETPDPNYDNAEEKKNIQENENKTAQEKGEVQRADHSGKIVQVPTVTTVPQPPK